MTSSESIFEAFFESIAWIATCNSCEFFPFPDSLARLILIPFSVSSKLDASATFCMNLRSSSIYFIDCMADISSLNPPSGMPLYPFFCSSCSSSLISYYSSSNSYFICYILNVGGSLHSLLLDIESEKPPASAVAALISGGLKGRTLSSSSYSRNTSKALSMLTPSVRISTPDTRSPTSVAYAALVLTISSFLISLGVVDATASTSLITPSSSEPTSEPTSSVSKTSISFVVLTTVRNRSPGYVIKFSVCLILGRLSNDC